MRVNVWDPDVYLSFNDHRDRPAQDLMGRVHAETARRVVDLGCGAGNLTGLLTRRWPMAEVEALDSSPEMVRAARERGVDARVQDVRDWQPQPDTDVVLCNAVLQWVPEHVELLGQWLPALPERAWFAFQVPGNFASPSYVEIRELAAEPEWRGHTGEILRTDSVLPAEDYADLLTNLGMVADAWETTYIQRLTGDDPVLDWMTGTALRPIRAALDDDQWQRFHAALAPRLRAAYPRRDDGTTWFPFRRIFAVAHR